MPMTLEEAIDHAYEVGGSECSECALQHLQLAEWLTELLELRNTEKVKVPCFYVIEHAEGQYRFRSLYNGTTSAWQKDEETARELGQDHQRVVMYVKGLTYSDGSLRSEI